MILFCAIMLTSNGRQKIMYRVGTDKFVSSTIPAAKGAITAPILPTPIATPVPVALFADVNTLGDSAYRPIIDPNKKKPIKRATISAGTKLDVRFPNIAMAIAVASIYVAIRFCNPRLAER